MVDNFDSELFEKRFNEVIKGDTYKAVAQKIGVKPVTISSWFHEKTSSGKKVLPSIQNLIAIANIYDTSVDYLVGVSDNLHGGRSEAHPDLTARDVCKMIADIDNSVGLNIYSQLADQFIPRKMLEPQDGDATHRKIVTDLHYSIDTLVTTRLNRIDISFPVGVESMTPEGENPFVNLEVPLITTDFFFSINKFLRNYIAVKNMPDLKPEMGQRLIDSYLSDVPDKPLPGKHNGKYSEDVLAPGEEIINFDFF